MNQKEKGSLAAPFFRFSIEDLMTNGSPVYFG
jgi:hypothetical protein